MAKQLESITGTFDRVRWRSGENDFVIALLDGGRVVLGNAADGALVPGITYQFYGRWEENEKHGRQFRFTQFTQNAPHSRTGVIAYLTRYARGIGPATAAQLWDAFGTDAVKVLRTDPERAAAASRHLPIEKAHLAAKCLQAIQATEDAKIELVNLFATRGFPGKLVDECIEKWGIMAPERIRRDPYCLLVERLSGCGFARCDRLYVDLGLPSGRLKRQMLCLWHLLASDSSGDTWLAAELVVCRLGQMVSGAGLQPKKAIAMGVRSRWIARRTDADGKLWLAEGERARSESYLASKLLLLSRWSPTSRRPLPTLMEENDATEKDCVVAAT